MSESAQGGTVPLQPVVAGTSFDVDSYSEPPRATSGISERLSVGLSFHSNEELAGASKGLSSREATANFVIACVGSGVVVFPRTMADTGIVLAAFLFLVVSAACAVCGLLVATCCTMAEEATGAPKGSTATYEAMVQAALGSHGRRVLMISKNLYCCGLLIVYMLLESTSLSTWIEMDETVITFAIVLPIFLLLAMLKDLKAVAKLSCLGITAAFTQVLCMEAGAVFEWFEPAPKTYKLASFNVALLGASTATFVFAFGSVAAIPTIRAQMANCDELPQALQKGLIIVWVIYGTIMGIGYLGFGDGVADNMIDNITKGCTGAQCIMGSGSAISIIINLFISAPTFMYVVFSVFQASGSSAIHTPLTLPNIGLRASFVLVLALIASVAPYVKQIIGLLSAVFGVCNIIAFPVFCYYALKKQLRGVAGSVREYPHEGAMRCAHAMVCVLGVITLIFGVYGGVKELVKKINEGSTP